MIAQLIGYLHLRLPKRKPYTVFFLLWRICAQNIPTVKQSFFLELCYYCFQVSKEGYQCPEHVFSIAIGWLLLLPSSSPFYRRSTRIIYPQMALFRLPILGKNGLSKRHSSWVKVLQFKPKWTFRIQNDFLSRNASLGTLTTQNSAFNYSIKTLIINLEHKKDKSRKPKFFFTSALL